MEKLETYLSDLASLFEHKYDDSFFEYLKSISVPNTTTCGKQINLGDGGWKCKDCELDTYSIYCNECFIKEKHIGHEIFFNPRANGYCDCGVNLVLKPEGFCDKHKGDYDNMKDLMDFIKSSISEKLLDKINDIFNKIFLLLIDKIKCLKNEQSDDEEEDKEEENQEENDELYKMIDYLEAFLDKLYKNNLSLFYFFTIKFTENLPYETNHKCFWYDENKNLITFIKKDNEQKHTCICPFFQVLVYVLMKRETKQNSSSFFTYFIQTYKNKTITSLCFLNTLSELFYNSNLKSFREMGYQLVGEFLGILLFKDNNISFLEECFEDIYSLCEKCFKQKEYGNLQEILFRFYQIIKYLPSKTIIDNINYNTKIINIIINICCLINNANEFENKTKLGEFQREGFEIELLNYEIFSILTIISLIHIINYDNEETVNSIFNNIFEKLNEFKKYKENLPSKKFTPHLVTIKCYTLFLNRFCFDYSIKHECDLLDSFNYFQNKFPQAKELNCFIFGELINFFGFMISQYYSFFKYFGSSMFSYYVNYSKTILNFLKCDITLIKYLLTLSEIKENFNIKNILRYSDIDSSNEFLTNLFNDNLNINNIELKDDSEGNNLKYFNSILEFIYLIIRDNLSMEKIAFRDINFKVKMKDEIYEKLYLNEKEKIETLVKNDIIHFILGNKNLIRRDDCIEYLSKVYDDNYTELVDEIIKKDCEKIILSNGLIVFSLKKEILNLCDIDFLITFKSRKSAFEYMTNFQSKNFDPSNIYLLEPLNIEKKLMKNIYQTYYNDKNINELIQFYNFIYNNKEKMGLLYNIFYSNLTKIISFAYKLCSTDLLDEDFKLKLLEKINNVNDKQFQKEKISDKKDKKSLKEKLKKQFDKKNEILKDRFITSDMDIEEEIQNENEICVYCRQSFNKDDSNNLEYFGKICYYFSDYLTDIINKIPEDKRKKARKFVTCNHKIHFKCFYEFIIKFNKEFECPLCKKLSNIILFDFSNILENNYDLIKAINYTDEKINLEQFYKIDEDNKYKELISSNILTFENYCSKLFHREILIKDFNEDNTLLERALKLLMDDFEESIIYYSRTNNKKDQIEIWKNILYNIRLLFKYKILNITSMTLQLIDDILNINKVEIFEKLLVNFDFSFIVNIFIAISFILFDSDEENKEKIKNIFKNKILLYFIYIAFIKSNNNDNLENFITNNKNELKKALELYYLKYKISLLLFNEKEENININLNLEEIISSVKSNPDFIKLLNSAGNNNYLEHIKEQCLEIPEFNIIELPERGLEFLNQTNGNCFYCNKKNLSSYLCLFCGKKICNSVNCFVDYEAKNRKEFSLIYHSIKCSGGNSLFLNIRDCAIEYVLKRRIIDSKIVVYMNDFGETMKDNLLSDEYKLNRDELKKAIQKFIDMTYRKKSTKCYFLNN